MTFEHHKMRRLSKIKFDCFVFYRCRGYDSVICTSWRQVCSRTRRTSGSQWPTGRTPRCRATRGRLWPVCRVTWSISRNPRTGSCRSNTSSRGIQASTSVKWARSRAFRPISTSPSSVISIFPTKIYSKFFFSKIGFRWELDCCGTRHNELVFPSKVSL